MGSGYDIGFIGGGNMARAVIFSLLSQNRYNRMRITVSDVNPDLHNIFTQKNIFFCTDNSQVVKSSDIIFLAVKPQQINSVLDEIADLKEFTNGKTFVSFAAGFPAGKIQNKLSNANIIRVMPNTPILIGEGATALSFDFCNDEAAKLFVLEVFKECGVAHVIKEELMDEIISVNASSPAYFYLFVNEMVCNAVKQGIDKDVARNLAAQAMLGSAKMLMQTDRTIDELIYDVTSKGGTTIEAVNYFKQCGLGGIIDKAMDACTKRAKELSKL